MSILEYIWFGGNNELRSKTRVITDVSINSIQDIPLWNYDGSSTNQADSNSNTEVILKPCAIYKDPLRNSNTYNNLLVLCETYDEKGDPLETNNRYYADKIFELCKEEEPWFGLEQEFFILPNSNITNNIQKTTKHYCGTILNYIDRIIMEEHLQACLKSGLKICGINAEVSIHQWEFQIGPCVGIQASDELIIARFLLERIAEKHERVICYNPKLQEDINGSGCHTNFSTKSMRNNNGLAVILGFMKKLEEKHEEHIKYYGENNEKRLTGLYETSSYYKFTYGVGTRNTSVRIGNQTYKEKRGYFEDRRPAANMDPYLVTSSLFKEFISNNL